MALKAASLGELDAKFTKEVAQQSIAFDEALEHQHPGTAEDVLVELDVLLEVHELTVV